MEDGAEDRLEWEEMEAGGHWNGTLHLFIDVFVCVLLL